MASIYSCKECSDKQTFESRRAAIEAGWTFAEVVDHARTRYFVYCNKHKALSALAKALIDEEKKPK